ncbi:MAG: glutaredoxin family protein [Acidimicrobiia bacterium]
MQPQDARSETPPLTVYGATWCPDCRRAKKFLGEQRVPFDWIDLDEHPEAVAEVEARNGGKRIIPTIVFPDGSHLAEPANDELADRLGLRRAPPRPATTSSSWAAARRASPPPSTPPARTTRC